MTKRKRVLPRGWYPFEGKDCRREIESYVEGWSPPGSIPEQGSGGIVPHAGWYFSGKLASRVLHSLKSDRQIDVVVLYGGHMGPEDLPRIVSEETCETPLGDIEIHQDFLKTLMKKVEVKKESPSSGDNTIEIQLAMIKYFFPESKLLAIRPPFPQRRSNWERRLPELQGMKVFRFLRLDRPTLPIMVPITGL